MKKITFSVTNDLVYDQRMQRICSSLAQAGYKVTLIGRKLKASKPLYPGQYHQYRLTCFFRSGMFMYLEFNLRLLIKLLFTPSDCYCAIDLDTILPNLLASNILKKSRVYDAHELFTEQKEIITRPFIHKIWKRIEAYCVPKFPDGYTVNDFIAGKFKVEYGVNYITVKNLPLISLFKQGSQVKERCIIYQGAVNEGRSFETLIPAMKMVNARLFIYGQGNFFKQAEQLIAKYELQDKIELKGCLRPEQLKEITPKAYIGVMLFEKTGLNQYQSLANRFFDYIMAGLPQVCVDYPQYRAINNEHHVASLISDTHPETIARALNRLLEDDSYYRQLKVNCHKARHHLNWENEKEKLINFYNTLFAPAEAEQIPGLFVTETKAAIPAKVQVCDATKVE